MAEADAEAPAEGPDETTPLRRSDTRIDPVHDMVAGTNEFPPKGSVYTLTVFMPELSRKRYGHFCTVQNLNAFSLFLLNVVLQVSLTCIAGSHILKEHKNWRSSLIYNPEYMQGVEAGIADAFAKEGHRRFGGMNSAWEDFERRLDGAGQEEEGCCAGVECAGYGARCCAPGRGGSHASSHAGGQQLAGLQRSSLSRYGRPKASDSEKKNEDPRGEPTTSRALCIGVNNTVKCSPPTSRFLDHWSDLDYDGDGRWTMEEAKADRANLACRLGIKVEDIFRSCCRAIELDSKDTAEHGGRQMPVAVGVTERREVPRAAFALYRGLVALCTSTDASHCGRLVTEGVFAGALDPRRQGWRGGIRDLDSAMGYCLRMLEPGGLCDSMMPGTYTLYRSLVREKCGLPSYSLGPRYVNPFNPHDVIGVSAVTFGHLDEFKTTHSFPFQFTLALIIMLWYFNLMDEVCDIFRLSDFLYNFPVRNVFPFWPPYVTKKIGKQFSFLPRVLTRGISLQEIMHSGDDLMDDAPSFDFITRPHQFTCICMLVIRALLVVYMGFVGTVFLLSNHNLVDLLLNAVALAFVVELDEFLYNFLVPEQTKRLLESMEPLTFFTSLPPRGSVPLLLRRETLGFIMVPIIACTVVFVNDVRTTTPVLESLRCLCQHAGERCEVTQQFPKGWWDSYWEETARLLPPRT